MGTKTAIEWTDATWNPIRGCSRVSEGCRNCYAESVAYRFSGAGLPYEGLAVLKNGHASWTGKVEFVEKHLLDPLKWKAPRRIFVNSMSDLFHENVTDEMRDRIFAVMALCPQHTFQVLTKRPERMLKYLSAGETRLRVLRSKASIWQAGERHEESLGLPRMALKDAMLPNVWLGVSDEGNQHQRIDILRQVPASVRFISAEPLLFDPGVVDLTGIDWVICGGESGPKARPMHPEWARSLRDQCTAAGVLFFFKQHGEWLPLVDYDVFVHGAKTDKYPHAFTWRTGQKNDAELPISSYRVGKHAAGALLDGVEWKQFPEARA